MKLLAKIVLNSFLIRTLLKTGVVLTKRVQRENYIARLNFLKNPVQTQVKAGLSCVSSKHAIASFHS